MGFERNGIRQYYRTATANSLTLDGAQTSRALRTSPPLRAFFGIAWGESFGEGVLGEEPT